MDPAKELDGVIARVRGAIAARVDGVTFGWLYMSAGAVAVISMTFFAGIRDPSRRSPDRIITWIDINAPYYPSYDSAYPANLAGRSPLDKKQITRLSKLTRVAFDKLASCKANEGPQISFDRPGLSRCLAGLKEADPSGYKEALGIIRDGKKMLAKTPRAEMKGFVAAAVDRRRQEKYAARREVELSNRSAIRDEQKIKD